LAVSYGGGSYRLYVDGGLVAAVDAVESVANAPSTLYLGATARNERSYDTTQGQLWWPPIDGFIAEVRISSGNRYPSDFRPEPQLSPDPSTLGLWRLDEGDGDLAADSGPNRLPGSIFGAQWELAPIRATATAAFSRR
jgi:hypothetical protein